MGKGFRDGCDNFGNAGATSLRKMMLREDADGQRDLNAGTVWSAAA